MSISSADPKKFQEVALLVDPDGVVAPITVSDKDGNIRLSFAVMREFDKNGEVGRTAFLNRRHIPAAIRLLERMAEAMDAEEDKLRATRRRPPVTPARRGA
jgi:hypothetical protein